MPDLTRRLPSSRPDKLQMMPDYSSPSGSFARARALGTELVEVHNWLRAELVRIRNEVDSDSGDMRQSLQAHCAAFCTTLTRHHTSEDRTAFAMLGEAFPELAPVLEQLRQDHRLVADIVGQLSKLLTTLTTENTGRVRREIDGLAAILESHFQWEERRLAAALDALDPPPRAEELFGRGAVGETGLA